MVQGLLIAVASLVAEHGLWGMWAQYSSWALVHRLNHCTCMGLAASLRVGSGIRILNHCIAREVSMITIVPCTPPLATLPLPFSACVSLEAVTSLGLSQEVCGDVTRCISTLFHLSLPSPSLLFLLLSLTAEGATSGSRVGPCLNPSCLGSGSAGLSPDP